MNSGAAFTRHVAEGKRIKQEEVEDVTLEHNYLRSAVLQLQDKLDEMYALARGSGADPALIAKIKDRSLRS